LTSVKYSALYSLRKTLNGPYNASEAHGDETNSMGTPTQYTVASRTRAFTTAMFIFFSKVISAEIIDKFIIPTIQSYTHHATMVHRLTSLHTHTHTNIFGTLSMLSVSAWDKSDLYTYFHVRKRRTSTRIAARTLQYD
jgi:hypothetical protein